MSIDGRRILRWHAGFLMTLTPLLTLGAYVGLFTGSGPYGGLAENPMAVPGLAQAYPLMGLVAVAMWMGATGPVPRRYSLLAIAAHCIPLSALTMLWDPIMASPIAPAIPLSFLIHGGGITAELVSIRVGYGETLPRASE
ncbi:hypothetical protein FE840_019390 (plasmid) [Peteryoungia desertarenae]|uniref:Uncharacterized protein n=1 Tax=Peteryoungia desertarenae TaxID=1813451 RepID=A0ABX6QTH1_9HYPH|nr:hypothetical protein [Peteryoungia desertarenae]QLF71784.1 hypothetical protein FE840_019390 [Peteryoungia desertarenae]